MSVLGTRELVSFFRQQKGETEATILLQAPPGTLKFNALDWYWFVGGNTAQVYHSGRDDYFPVIDAQYQDFLLAGGITSTVPCEPDLLSVILEATKGDIIQQIMTVLADKVDVDELAAVAMSNDYQDLENRPATTPQTEPGDAPTDAPANALTNYSAVTLLTALITGVNQSNEKQNQIAQKANETAAIVNDIRAKLLAYGAFMSN